ncbi:MAG: hypothetical protein ACRD07_11970 [Acidimicrobiales bacterium]
MTWRVFVRAHAESDLDCLNDAEMFDGVVGERFRVTDLLDEDDQRKLVVRTRKRRLS